MTVGVREKYDTLFRDGIALTNRWESPDDIGRVVIAFTNRDFSYSTGQVFVVDGGLSVERL